MRRTIAISVLVLLPAGCDLSDEAEPHALMPLAVGNYWAYSTTLLGGAITDSIRVEITAKLPVTFHGRKFTAFARSDFFRGLPPPTWAWLYANGPNGLYAMGGIAETDTLVLQTLNRKYPAHVGETWPAVRFVYRQSSTGDFAAQDTVIVSLEAVEEPFVVPAGSFRCHVYKYSFRPEIDVAAWWNVYEYYVPGVGLIAETVTNQSIGRPKDPDLRNPDIKHHTVLYQYRVQ